MSANSEKYQVEVLKKLEDFKFAKEWSDFIGLLDSLCSIFKKYRQNYVPCIPQLVKRLNQLLNPTLPGGVHLKTFECYTVIFELASKENILKEFEILTVGLFNFSLNYKVAIAGEYLNLLESVIFNLGPQLGPFSEMVILGFIPFLESESSEFFNRAYNLLNTLLSQITEDAFFDSMWKIFISYPELRSCVLNFFFRYKVVVISDYCLVTTALCEGMNTTNSFIIRSLLDISNRDFPLNTDTNDMPGNDTLVDNKSSNKSSSKSKTLKSPTLSCLSGAENDLPDEISGLDEIEEDLNLSGLEESVENFQSSLIDLTSDNTTNLEIKQQYTIKDLAKIRDKTDEDKNSSAYLKEKTEFNNKLIKNVLRIFLIKEVSINKRAYEWFNLGDVFNESDVVYLERGLRMYLNGLKEDLITFYEVMNSLDYRDNLSSLLIERLILDSFQLLKNLDISKNTEIDILLKKKAKIFINSFLNDIYRVLYIKIDDAFTKYSDSDGDSGNSMEEAKNLLDLAIFLIETLDAIDQSVIYVHIPLLAHIIIRNRKKISEEYFDFFLNLMIEKVELPTEGNDENNKQQNIIVSELKASIIRECYQKDKTAELLEYNLTAAVSKELSKMTIYDETCEEYRFWSDSALILNDGILEWTEMKNAYKINNDCENRGYFNFSERDMLLITKYIRKFGFNDFHEEFLQHLGKYLCFNYKYIDLVKLLEIYVDNVQLNVNLWNDFVISKNAQFLVFYGEGQLLKFLNDVVPSASLKDICIFLKTALKSDSFISILFQVASIADTQSNYFLDLLLYVENPIPIIEHLLLRFSQMESYNDESQIKFDVILPILSILEILIENENFIDILKSNYIIDVEKFGKTIVLDAITNMINIIIVKKYFIPSDDDYFLEESEDFNHNSYLLKYQKNNSLSETSSPQEKSNSEEADVKQESQCELPKNFKQT